MPLESGPAGIVHRAGFRPRPADRRIWVLTADRLNHGVGRALGNLFSQRCLERLINPNLEPILRPIHAVGGDIEPVKRLAYRVTRNHSGAFKVVAASCQDMFPPELDRVGNRGLSSCRLSNAAAMRELLLVVSRIITPTLSIIPAACWLASRAVMVALPVNGTYAKCK